MGLPRSHAAPDAIAGVVVALALRRAGDGDAVERDALRATGADMVGHGWPMKGVLRGEAPAGPDALAEVRGGEVRGGTSMGDAALARMTPGHCLGELMAMLRRVMFWYVALAGGLHLENGSVGQQMEQGWAAQRSMESDCCAGPTQMAHCSGASITMSSYSTSRMRPSPRNFV